MLADHAITKYVRSNKCNYQNCSEDYFADSKLQPSACNAGAALFLAGHFFASKNNADKQWCTFTFQWHNSEKKKAHPGDRLLFV